MEDGVVLLADRWFPPALDRPPVVLLRCPYGRRQIGIIGRLFAERGYQTIIQSTRGGFGSGGDWVPFRNERADGKATLAWLAEQPWYGGSVYTFGPSYLGIVQWAMASDAPADVKAMAPIVTSAFVRNDVIYPGNTLALETLLAWVYQVEYQELPARRMLLTMARRKAAVGKGHNELPVSSSDMRVVGRSVEFVHDWLRHEAPDDAWWEPVDFRPARALAPPATFLGGWYDIFLPGQIEDFVAMRAAGREARMTIGPWTHASPAGMGTSIRDALAWFDSHGGSSNGRRPESGARLFVMGSKRWVDVAEWPPPATPERWHLQSGGRLSPETPLPSNPDRFRFDPNDPTPGIGGPSLDSSNAGRKDQGRREERADVLTYTSAPMERDVTVAGPLAVDLWFRSTLDHTDVSVRLCVVSTKGRSDNLSDGYRRLRPEDVEVGEDGTSHVLIDMWPTAATFRRGERIRLQVAGAAHPLFNRNLGTGEPIGTASVAKTAEQQIFHDPEHPSAIVLPMSTI
jgi:hypothetical protein